MMKVIMLVGTVLAAVYVLTLLLAGKKYDYMIEPLDPKEYRMPELYSFGFVVMTVFKHNFSSKSEQQRRKCLSILKGEKYADYYLQVEYAKRISLSTPVLIFAFILAVLGDEPALCLVIGVIAIALDLYIGREPSKLIEKKTEELLAEFPDVVSKLALLTNAGMIMRQAWEKVAFSGKGSLYTEMQLVCQHINDGMSEPDAYFEFGSNCVIPEIKKFASTVITGIIRGNRELSFMLKEQSAEVWEVKMNLVKRQGDAAVSKLIVPMMMVFMGIVIMIVVPIFSNMGI